MTTLQGRHEFQNTVAGQPGSAGENGAVEPVYEAEAEAEKKKGLDPDRARSTQKLESGIREKTKQTGVRNRKLAPGAKTGITSKAVQQG